MRPFFMEERRIKFDYTARYYTIGELSEDPTQEVWIVLHGYGQLAKYFVQKFRSVVRDGAFVVAPEGLSLFYLQGTDGRVGASWMTRECREQAINNYTAYLQHIYQSLPLQSKRIVLFSFSQGGATLIRWVVRYQVPFQKMIVWAGGFPPDVDPVACQEVFRNKSLFYVYGDEDEYISSKGIAKQKALFQQFHFHPNIIQFRGKHVIDPEVLSQIQQKSRSK